MVYLGSASDTIRTGCARWQIGIPVPRSQLMIWVNRMTVGTRRPLMSWAVPRAAGRSAVPARSGHRIVTPAGQEYVEAERHEYEESSLGQEHADAGPGRKQQTPSAVRLR